MAKEALNVPSWRFANNNIHVALIEEPKGLHRKTGYFIYNRCEEKPKILILVFTQKITYIYLLFPITKINNIDSATIKWHHQVVSEKQNNCLAAYFPGVNEKPPHTGLKN